MPSIAVVGGGLGGVGAVTMLARAGHHDVTVFERSERVGGVWNDNTYPGAACDVPSHLYEFSFAPNPRWSRRYAPQPEIQAYLEDVARRHGVLDRIRTSTEVGHARWNAQTRSWTLQTNKGPHEADVLLTACGQLSVPKTPEIPGLETFEGPAFHTARWRHDVSLENRRVALIGTGCSAIQVGPAIQPKVTPRDEIGCKRVMLTDDWYPTLTKPNVELVTERIELLTPTGVRTTDGVDRPADVLIFATGFATHGFVAPMEVIGDQTRTLAATWGECPRAYLGLTVPGFPNMFLIYGPNTNGGTGSVIFTIEAGVQHVIEALDHLERMRADAIEVRAEAFESFNAELKSALACTVWHTGCTNWYVDERGNDPNQWPWLWSQYRRRTDHLEPAAYALH